jgi:replicative DNA helicase
LCDTLPDAEGEVPIRATIAKNRNGAAGTTVPLAFAGGFMRFRESDVAVASLAARRRRTA